MTPDELRKLAREYDGLGREGQISAALRQAADEIERLREYVPHSEFQKEQMRREVRLNKDLAFHAEENARLREALDMVARFPSETVQAMGATNALAACQSMAKAALAGKGTT